MASKDNCFVSFWNFSGPDAPYFAGIWQHCSMGLYSSFVYLFNNFHKIQIKCNWRAFNVTITKYAEKIGFLVVSLYPSLIRHDTKTNVPKCIKLHYTHRIYATFLMFCWPCIVIHPYNKNQQDALFIFNLFQ